MVSPRTLFEPLFQPRTIAVFGASTAGRGFANDFIQATLKLGFTGEIYPIHPKATEIEGLKAYPTLDATPSPIDYAFIGIGARHIPAILAAANGRVKFAQVISSGFGEMGDGGKALEAELVRAAHAGGMRCSARIVSGPTARAGASVTTAARMASSARSASFRKAAG